MINLGLGLQLMAVGMVTVFAILLIVIYGSRYLIKLINRIAPEEVKPEKKSADDLSSVRPVLDAAVSQITGGKGHIVNISKLK